jgi:tetratricopeptide (TPR) repeat protein
MTHKSIPPGAPDEPRPIEALAAVADEIFERASKLDGLALSKKDDGTASVVSETRDDAFRGCIRLWKIILRMLPTADLDQPTRHALEQDAYKIVSRCHHRLGNLEGARRNIARGIDAGYTDGFISLGAICLDLGDFEAAEDAFRSALGRGVQLARAHAGLGELYFTLGTRAPKGDPKQLDYFSRSEEEFIAAGKERFTEGFDRALDLFETMGLRDRALRIGQRAAAFYGEHKGHYGQKLLSLNRRLRKIAGDQRHERIVGGVGRKLGRVLGGRKEDE